MGHATEFLAFTYLWTFALLVGALGLWGVARLLLTLYHACVKLLLRRPR